MNQNNVFLKHLAVSDAPWQLKQRHSETPNEPIVELRDLHGEHIADIPSSRSIRPKQQRANRAAIVNAPRLLAALIEYAYTAHTQGWHIHPSLAQLIQDSGGPDLSDIVSKDDETS
jgi:hypothetical protein